MRGPVGFDLDMTLINSRRAILASFAEVARETGTAIDLDAVDRRLGIKLEDELASWFPPDQVAAAAGLYRRHYLPLAERMTTALPGAREALAAVRAAGQRVIIITAKHPVSVGPSLRAAGLSADELFTLVHGAEKATVLRRLQAAAYVGDTPSVGLKCGASREIADEWLLRYPADASVMAYIGRSGWNTLRIGGSIPDEDLLEAVDASYSAVVSKLPKKDRP